MSKKELTKVEPIDLDKVEIPEVLVETVRRVAGDFAAVAEGMTHAFDDDEELEKLPPKMRRVAEAALLPKSQAPFALHAAAEFVKEHARLINMNRQGERLNIHLHKHEHDVVSMPPMSPPPADHEVIVVDPEAPRSEEHGPAGKPPMGGGNKS